MTNILNAISNRSSVRSYKPEPVPVEILDQIAAAGSAAATGNNRQSPVILVVTDPEVRNELSRINAEVLKTDKDPFYGAPNVIVVLADRSIPTYLFDGSLVMGNMMLAVEELGLGSCWIHRAKEEFESEYGKALLAKAGIEGDYVGVANLIVGYIEGEKPEPKVRKENYIYHI